jgi:uncharacterized short protein YbdD (DUF466 family)
MEGALMNRIGALRERVSGVAWFIRGVLGEDAYDKYREHYAATHPDADSSQHPPMSEREFWRDRADRQDAHPEGRCC